MVYCPHTVPCVVFSEITQIQRNISTSSSDQTSSGNFLKGTLKTKSSWKSFEVEGARQPVLFILISRTVTCLFIQINQVFLKNFDTSSKPVYKS